MVYAKYDLTFPVRLSRRLVNDFGAMKLPHWDATPEALRLVRRLVFAPWFLRVAFKPLQQLAHLVAALEPGRLAEDHRVAVHGRRRLWIVAPRRRPASPAIAPPH